MKLADLKHINQKSIQSAGPRYTPGQDANAPNLEITGLNTALEGLTCGSSFQERICGLSSEIEKSFTSATKSMRGRTHARLRKPSALIAGLESFASTPPGDGRSLATRLMRYTGGIETATKQIGNILYKAEQERREVLQNKDHDPYSIDRDPELRTIQNQQTHLRNYQAAISDVEEFLRSPGCKLQYNNLALLLGEWGTGKTHYLCDFALTCIDQGIAALIVLAKDFEPDPDVGTALAQYTGLASSLDNLITHLNTAGTKSGRRAILIIDGINESDRQKWRKSIDAFRKTVKKYPYVGLVLSCRQPFEDIIFKDVDRRRFIELSHHGFSDIEFDAQSEFFHFYDIPLPEVPLLAEEFSRPLTLKIMCEAFKELPRRNQRRGFSGLTSGQRGMTFILEKFIKNRAKNIESDLKLTGSFCWNLIKGDNRIGDPSLAGLAPHMADAMQEYAPKERCLEMIRARSSTSKSHTAQRLYRRLLAEGILVEDIEWRPDEEGGSLTVVRFPYQRFGDHLIARYLLGKYLDTSSEQAIRRSLYKNNKLGSLFLMGSPHFPQYVMEGWVEALVVEFPERTKNVLPENSRELFFYLPKVRQDLRAYFAPFVGGLFWRNPSSICEQTDKIVGTVLWNYNEYARTRLLEALLAVATKPEHPYHGARLFLNLEDLEVVDRDMMWSEFLRKRTSDSTIERLVLWFEKGIPNGISKASALNQIHILSLFLTTNDRLLRDRVTKVLVQIGEKFPKALFSHAEYCLSFSDPYVPERMLAASYGVAMSLWSDGKADSFHKHLPDFARALVREIFIPDGCLVTHHTLIRDYALGIIELARKTHRGCIAPKYVKYIQPPFPGIHDPFPGVGKIREQDCKDVEHAIHMDFGNYTIGHLVSGRANYDMDHPEYKEIRKKIEWRIRNQGYQWKDFEQIEQTIGRESYWRTRSEQGKIDRYGKKYSWIAFFEMHGLLQSQGKLPDHRQVERLSDCDIDPSFPEIPPEWEPTLHTLFSDKQTDELDWICRGPAPGYEHLLRMGQFDSDGGPWVLLDGHMQENDEATGREIFSFLQGLILDESDISELEKLLASAEHPGSGLPDAGQDVYTFAGEVPWSMRFASSIRTKSGKFSQVTDEAFSGTSTFTKKRRLKKSWKYLYEILGEVPSLNRIVIVTSEQDDEYEELDQGKLERAIIEANSKVSERDRITAEDLYNQVPTYDDIHNGYQFVSEWKHLRGVPVETTSWYYGWESYHSRLNAFTGFRFPAPRICEQVGLVGRHRSIELVDQKGKRAAIYRKSKQDNGSRFDLLYLRKDLLDRYLRMNRRALVWIIWGERQVHHGMLAGLKERPEVSKAFQNHEHIHKKLVRY